MCGIDRAIIWHSLCGAKLRTLCEKFYDTDCFACVRLYTIESHDTDIRISNRA